MREVVTLHVGQAGINIAEPYWDLLSFDLDLNFDGTKKTVDNEKRHMHFSEDKHGRYTARALCLDLESDAINPIKQNENSFWNPSFLIHGEEGGGNNYGRGYSGLGLEYIEQAMEGIRKAVEDCNGLQGFYGLRALGGGTGSGFASRLLERIKDEYPKKYTIDWLIFPDYPQQPEEKIPLASPIVDIYNAVLSTESLVTNLDMCSIMHNKALYDICANRQRIPDPSYSHINRLLAQVIEMQTVPPEGVLGIDVTEWLVCIPYPSIHFWLPSYATYAGPTNSSDCYSYLTNEVFDAANCVATCNLTAGKMMNVGIKYRGEDVVPKMISAAIGSFKASNKIQFVEWTPVGMKVGMDRRQVLDWSSSISSPSSNEHQSVPSRIEAHPHLSCLSSCNSTAVGQIFEQWATNFDKLYKKKAFLHWFEEQGLDQQDFVQQREALQRIITDYNELASVQEEEELET